MKPSVGEVSTQQVRLLPIWPRTRARPRRRRRRRARPRSRRRSRRGGADRTVPGGTRRGRHPARRCPGRPARSAGHRRRRWRPCTAGTRPARRGAARRCRHAVEPEERADSGSAGPRSRWPLEVGNEPAHLHEVSPGKGGLSSTEFPSRSRSCRCTRNGAAQPITGKRSSSIGSHGFMSVVSKFGHGEPFQQMSAGWVTRR